MLRLDTQEKPKASTMEPALLVLAYAGDVQKSDFKVLNNTQKVHWLIVFINNEERIWLLHQLFSKNH